MEQNTDELKVCYLCGELKHRDEYYRGKNKINSRCKECDKKRRVEIRKKRKELEPHYKILLTLKSRMKIEFKKYNYTKTRGKTYEDIIGCDAIVLKEHLEKQFVDGKNVERHKGSPLLQNGNNPNKKSRRVGGESNLQIH